jgi:cytochrome b subunit of formate dehydrogenase
MISFTVLALTGLPQIYASSRVGERLIALLGGIELTRLVHRGAAIVMMVAGLVHLLDVAYRFLVEGRPLSMWPGRQDVRDFVSTVRFNFGRASERPRLGRFSFEEKIEYWSLLWGTVIMVATGFALWNPIATARFLPGQFIPAALAAHAGEALLAVLAVIVWHGYGVHIRHFNRSMFTGEMSEQEMRAHHPLELEALLENRGPAEPPPLTLQRRRRLFLPVAALVTLLCVFGLYRFVTFEETAIATVTPPPP